MLALEVEDEELISRLLESGKSSGRVDDQNREVIKNRIEVYERETAILKDYYSAQNKYIGVSGVGSVSSITENLSKEIDALI